MSRFDPYELDAELSGDDSGDEDIASETSEDRAFINESLEEEEEEGNETFEEFEGINPENIFETKRSRQRPIIESPASSIASSVASFINEETSDLEDFVEEEIQYEDSEAPSVVIPERLRRQEQNETNYQHLLKGLVFQKERKQERQAVIELSSEIENLLSKLPPSFNELTISEEEEDDVITDISVIEYSNRKDWDIEVDQELGEDIQFVKIEIPQDITVKLINDPILQSIAFKYLKPGKNGVIFYTEDESGIFSTAASQLIVDDLTLKELQNVKKKLKKRLKAFGFRRIILEEEEEEEEIITPQTSQRRSISPGESRMGIDEIIGIDDGSIGIIGFEEEGILKSITDIIGLTTPSSPPKLLPESPISIIDSEDYEYEEKQKEKVQIPIRRKTIEPGETRISTDSVLNNLIRNEIDRQRQYDEAKEQQVADFNDTYDTYEEILQINTDFIKGILKISPYHNGPLEIDSQTVKDKLIKMHEYGLFTYDGQAGKAGCKYLENTKTGPPMNYQQRSYSNFVVPMYIFKKIEKGLLKSPDTKMFSSTGSTNFTKKDFKNGEWCVSRGITLDNKEEVCDTKVEYQAVLNPSLVVKRDGPIISYNGNNTLPKNFPHLNFVSVLIYSTKWCGNSIEDSILKVLKTEMTPLYNFSSRSASKSSSQQQQQQIDKAEAEWERQYEAKQKEKVQIPIRRKTIEPGETRIRQREEGFGEYKFMPCKVGYTRAPKQTKPCAKSPRRCRVPEKIKSNYKC